MVPPLELAKPLAASIAQALGMSNDNVHNVTEMTKEDLENNDVLILGSSTWGCRTCKMIGTME